MCINECGVCAYMLVRMCARFRARVHLYVFYACVGAYMRVRLHAGVGPLCKCAVSVRVRVRACVRVRVRARARARTRTRVCGAGVRMLSVYFKVEYLCLHLKYKYDRLVNVNAIINGPC